MSSDAVLPPQLDYTLIATLGKQEKRLLLLGLDSAGKASLLVSYFTPPWPYSISCEICHRKHVLVHVFLVVRHKLLVETDFTLAFYQQTYYVQRPAGVKLMVCVLLGHPQDVVGTFALKRAQNVST